MPTTVILGAGIIGLSTAHYLSKLAPPDHKIHLVEPASELFASASGKAAGFVAKDWYAPAVAPLGNLSFDLHRALADKHNGRARWGYSESISYSLDHTHYQDIATAAQSSSSDSAGRNGSQGQGGLDWLLNNASRAAVADGDVVEKAQSEADNASELPHWLRAKPDALQVISDKKTTAQVHPRQLCEFLLEQCLAAGVTLHHPARATKVWHEDTDAEGVTRIRVEYLGLLATTAGGRARTVDIPCDSIVITAGCWTPQVYSALFPNSSRMPRVTHLAGYSVTFKTKHWPPSSACHAIFTHAGGFAPEIFSRASGEIWLGGLNPASTPLPELPNEAQLDPEEVDRLLTVAHVLCGEDIELRGQALCFRPVSASGRPIITRLHEADLGDGPKPGGHDGAGGVYVATGHGPWGISLSLGTGCVLAEMILGQKTSADVSALMKW
ncbi:nucleotide-binding domain-containing protein [Trametes sanguinea]|nr:nucleotide-binding domain-containing protein [Trametes sanguinea]